MTTLPSRFWSKVSMGPGCWLWTGALQSAGYGVFNLSGRVRYAHRLAVADAGNVAYDATETVHHKCHVRRCVNPAHLESLTAVEHGALHAEELGAAPACRRGHSMADAYVRRDGGARQCRTCRREAYGRYERRYMARLEDRPCAACGKPFRPLRTRLRYCSRRCYFGRYAIAAAPEKEAA